MAQEALGNIDRHAQAKQASLRISFSPTSTAMEVINHGVGFNVPASPSEFAP
jgi:signal transduction histidine kinase